MSKTDDRNSAAPPCSLLFVSADVAKTWPTGSKVLLKRTSARGTTYEADNWHRPDWVDDKQRVWTTVEWAMLEAAKD